MRSLVGTPERLVSVIIDMSERRELEDQLRQAQKLEAIGQLAGGVAHDFNNLITIIQGYGTMLQDWAPDDSPARTHVDKIRHTAERAAALTRQLLAFSRRQVLDITVLDLGTVLKAVEPMLRRLIPESIAIRVTVAQGVGHVAADAGQMEQVILNLAVNARDAMPKGGTLMLDVSAAHLDAEYASQHEGVRPGDYIRLSVSDTGIGMDAATMARIFEPFYTTKPKGVGTGLGLSTVHGIVRQSGGHIYVYSEPELGSTFKIYLPQVNAVPEPVRAVPASTVQRTGHETILVTEDDKDIRELLELVLTRAGYTVLAAESPSHAVAMSRQHAETIHLLLCDVVLPEMNGPAMAAAMKQRRPDMRILFMSGYVEEPTPELFDLADAALLQKPFKLDTLLERVREVLDTGTPPR